MSTQSVQGLSNSSNRIQCRSLPTSILNLSLPTHTEISDTVRGVPTPTPGISTSSWGQGHKKDKTLVTERSPTPYTSSNCYRKVSVTTLLSLGSSPTTSITVVPRLSTP